jgi:hypothetical protein
MNVETSADANLDRLQRWLSFELSAGVLFLLSFFYKLVLYIFAAVAFIFIPFLLYVLYQQKRIGWIILLVLAVIGPAIVITFGQVSNMWSFILNYVIVAFFLFYCFALRLTIPGWERIQ